jgi:hypothetical protein
MDFAFGGHSLARDMRGFYLEPVQFTNATNQMRISREEKFGRWPPSSERKNMTRSWSLQGVPHTAYRAAFAPRASSMQLTSTATPRRVLSRQVRRPQAFISPPTEGGHLDMASLNRDVTPPSLLSPS